MALVSVMAILSLWVLIPKGAHRVHLRPSGNLSNGLKKKETPLLIPIQVAVPECGVPTEFWA